MGQLTFNQAIQGFPSYRVFIFGFEVTEDCTDVNIQWTAGRAPSFTTLTLLNPNDRYIYRREDMVIQFSDKVKSLATQAHSDLSAIYDAVINKKQIIQDSLNDTKSVKSRITALKRKDVYTITTNPIDPFSGNPKGPKRTPVYPVIEGKSCFHQNDPVRIFVQDPFDPATWYYGFSGFISKITDTVDGANLEKMLSIQVEDVSKSLRYARYSVNPGFRDPSKISTGDDLQHFTGFTSPLAKKSFQEAADFIVFGDIVKSPPPESAYVPVTVVDPKTGEPFSRLVLRTGAGSFKPLALKERVFTLAPSSNPNRGTTTLPDWQNYTLDHTVDISDLEDLRARSDNKTPVSSIVTALQDNVRKAKDAGGFNASLTWEIMTEIGSDPMNYPVDGGTLYMLLPEGLSKLGEDVVSQDFISSIAMVSEFKDRRSLMYDLVDRVEFVFYADPKGNLIIEFPLYDFDPDDFNDPSVRSMRRPATEDVIPPSVRFAVTQSDGSVLFDNERRFTVEDEAVENLSATDDDAPVRTICITVPAVSRSQAALSGGALDNAVRAAKVVRLDNLLPMYGPRVIQGDPRRITLTDRAALISGAIALNKTVAEAYTFKLNLLPRFAAWLNRPYLIRHRNHIATAASISHHIAWGSSVETTIGFHYSRGWQGELDSASGRMLYTPIGGHQSSPINYSELFAQQKTPNTSTPGTSSGSGTQNR